MPRVVVVGSINMDVVATAPRPPAPGETVLGTDLRFEPGGKGANQAVAASRLKAPTELVGRIGRDAFGDSLLTFLSSEAIDLAGVRRTDNAPTGTALVVVGADGENSIVVVPGANHTMTAADADLATIDAGDVVVAQFELPLEVTHAALARARREGARTILNPAPAQRAPDLLSLADVLVVNETELAFFAGDSAGDTTATRMRTLRQRPDQVVVTTLGAAGAQALIGEDVLEVRGREVAVVDTTGAGDTFVGALAAALCSWAETDEAVHFANLAASLSVQRFGASSAPLLSELEAAQ